MEEMEKRDPEMYAVMMQYRELWSDPNVDLKKLSDHEVRRRFPKFWELIQRRTQAEFEQEWRRMGFKGDPPKLKQPTRLDSWAETLNQQYGKSWTPLAWVLWMVVGFAILALVFSRGC